MLSPTLAGSYGKANAHQRRNATLAVAKKAIFANDLREPIVDQVLENLERDQVITNELSSALVKMSEQFDEEYLSHPVSDRSEIENELPEAFLNARIVASLAAMSTLHEDECGEALYEAISGMHDQEVGIQTAIGILKK